jgi:carbon-monoxide dehydrogenase iron sulfur subunit
MKKKIFCAVQLCLACKGCEIACAVEHSKTKSIIGALKEDSPPRKRRDVQGSKETIMSIACQHCKTAACVVACMAGAMYKDEEGNTVHDEDKCVGCGMCIMVCPFGVITRDKNIVLKCDLCPDMTDNYACVKACPTGALFAGTAEEFKKRLETRKVHEVKK